MPRIPLRILRLTHKAFLGFSVVTAWSYLASMTGVKCPVLDGGLIMRAVALILGWGGLAEWGIVLAVAILTSSLPRPARLTLAVIVAASSMNLEFAALLLSTASFTLLILESLKSIELGIQAILAGVILAETLNVAYSLGRVAGVYSPLTLVGPPLHLSLYCFTTWIAPLIVLAACLSPLITAGVRLASSPSRRLSSLERIVLDWRVSITASMLICLSHWAAMYCSALNPSGRLVGVDPVTRYYPHAIAMLREGPLSFLKVGHDRPLHYLLLLALSYLLGPLKAVKLLPLLCMVLYSMAIFTLVREFGGLRTAGLAALMAPLSYTTTTGLFGGLYSNWTSLSLATLACATLVRWFRVGGYRWAATYLLLLVATAASHIYMGAVAAAALTLTLIVEALKSRKALPLLALQLAVITAGLYVADTVVSMAGGRSPLSIVESNVRGWARSFGRVAGSGGIFSRKWWNSFSFAVYNYASTSALEPLGWLLTMVGAASLGLREGSGVKRVLSILLTSWLAVVTVLAFSAPFNLIYRSLYDFPYTVVEVVGLAYILEVVEEKYGVETGRLLLAALLMFRLGFATSYVVGLVA